MSFVVNISGIEYEVDINFFYRQEVIEERLVGDTYFIKCKDGSDDFFYFSIYKKVYDRLKLDKKIDDILK